MAIQVDGTTVIDDSRNITNVVSASVTSLSIGGTAVTASVSEINNQLSDVSNSYTLAEQIAGINTFEETQIVTLAKYEYTSFISNYSDSTAIVSVLKNVGGTLTVAIPGVDYYYESANDSVFRLTSLLEGDTEFHIRTINGTADLLVPKPVYFGTAGTDVTAGLAKTLTATVESANTYLAFISSDLSYDEGQLLSSVGTYTTVEYYSNINGASSSMLFATSTTGNTYTTTKTNLTNASLILIPTSGRISIGNRVWNDSNSLATGSMSTDKGDALITALYLQDDNHTSTTVTPPEGYTLIGSAVDSSAASGECASIFVAQKQSIADNTTNLSVNWSYDGATGNILGTLTQKILA